MSNMSSIKRACVGALLVSSTAATGLTDSDSDVAPSLQNMINTLPANMMASAKHEHVLGGDSGLTAGCEQAATDLGNNSAYVAATDKYEEELQKCLMDEAAKCEGASSCDLDCSSLGETGLSTACSDAGGSACELVAQASGDIGDVAVGMSIVMPICVPSNCTGSDTALVIAAFDNKVLCGDYDSCSVDDSRCLNAGSGLAPGGALLAATASLVLALLL